MASGGASGREKGLKSGISSTATRTDSIGPTIGGKRRSIGPATGGERPREEPRGGETGPGERQGEDSIRLAIGGSWIWADATAFQYSSLLKVVYILFLFCSFFSHLSRCDALARLLRFHFFNSLFVIGLEGRGGYWKSSVSERKP